MVELTSPPDACLDDLKSNKAVVVLLVQMWPESIPNDSDLCKLLVGFNDFVREKGTGDVFKGGKKEIPKQVPPSDLSCQHLLLSGCTRKPTEAAPENEPRTERLGYGSCVVGGWPVWMSGWVGRCDALGGWALF